MGRNRRRTALGLTIVILLAASARAALAPEAGTNFDLSWHTIDGGGGTSTGATFTLTATIGQHDASTFVLSGASFELRGGFWAGAGTPIPTCPGDIAPAGGNGLVNVQDMLAVINAWGACPIPPASCPADVAPPGGNGLVNVQDMLAVINAWGACP